MIYIFSQDEDATTNHVCRYLNHYEYDFVRLHRTSKNELELLRENIIRESYPIHISNEYCTSNIAFWYRRPGPSIVEKLSDLELDQNDVKEPRFSTPSEYFKHFKYNFIFHQRNFIASILSDERYRIGNYHPIVNKLMVLKAAVQVGISIPDTIIASTKKELNLFMAKHNGNIITKSLYEVIPADGAKEEGFYIDCNTVKIENIDRAPDSFYTTLIQEYVEKRYELRVFYFFGKCYAAAIFSQSNDKTKVDFRNYDWEFMNRMVPYELDDDLSEKITKLMEKLNLNTGSLDLIKGKNGKYYFLEVNPVGQYEFVDVPCNYHLNKKIAQHLIKIHEKEIGHS